VDDGTSTYSIIGLLKQARRRLLNRIRIINIKEGIVIVKADAGRWYLGLLRLLLLRVKRHGFRAFVAFVVARNVVVVAIVVVVVVVVVVVSTGYTTGKNDVANYVNNAIADNDILCNSRKCVYCIGKVGGLCEKKIIIVEHVVWGANDRENPR